MTSIEIYDTTLRDGTQGENISFSAEEKIRIVRRLNDLGIHYIEGGWPGSNPRDREFFRLVAKGDFHHSKIVAFGSTRKPGILSDKDSNLQALLKSQMPVVAIVGKTWPLHVTKIMKNSLEENLRMIYESVLFLKNHDREVIFDAEHFFDAYGHDSDYAIKVLAAANEGGADTLVLCDTNGGMLPFDIETIVYDVKKQFKNVSSLKLGIHAHNDCGMAVANSISAVRAGVSQVHGTINGYGERCGNADITTLLPILCLKMKYSCIPVDNLKKLKNLSRFVSEIANMIPLNNRPFVGNSAFAHKGGLHVNAIMKDPKAYEHMEPELVGNKRRVLVSDLSGKSNITYKAKELDIQLNGHDETQKIANEIKRLEQNGFQFDGAEASLKLFIKKEINQFNPAFELDSFRVAIEKNQDQLCKAHAVIKISVGSHIGEMVAAEGDGPVSALDNALRKALGTFFPHIDTMQLVDFKVRVIDGRDGTAAKVRVLIESRDENDIWTTIGVSEDIIEASWQALADSYYYKLNEMNGQPI